MADVPHPDAWRGTLKTRLGIVAVLFAVWTGAVEARLLWLQVYRHDELVQRADRQHARTLTLPAKRGDIVDRNGRVLATSSDVQTIYAVPTDIDNPRDVVTRLCAALDDCTREFAASLLERLSKRRPFQYVKRQVSPAEARRVAALKLEGIGFTRESRRFYPNRSLLASVLGYVGLDNKGLGGLELTFDKVIRGEDGQTMVYTDARKHAFNREDRPPTAGASLELTIDAVLQHIVERELSAGIDANRAEGGVAIVMDPWTGDILAMASEPTFNPNAFGEVDPELRRNRCISDMYEPGSTFKTVTAAAAFQEHVLTTESLIECAPGVIAIGSRRVRDVHVYGTLSFMNVIVKSSNVGAIRAGFRIGPERMLRYVRRFGFGSRLSKDLPGEQAGIVWPELNDSALASVSMGYQVGVTPLQMVTAVSSIANGGQLMRPRVVRAIHGKGVRKVIDTETIRRTISPETSATLTTVMEAVVEEGTAKPARIDGFTIAGKTGTAAKLENGVYSKQKYMASFVGFFPSRAPAAAVLVVIDTPRNGTYYGGSVAAPIFKRIAEATIQHLGLPRTIDPEQPVLVAREAGTAAPVRLGRTSVVSYGPPSGPDGVMPDLRGLSARAAVSAAMRVGLTPRVSGTGFVAVQDPMAGTPLETGTPVRLWLDREPPAVEAPAQP